MTRMNDQPKTENGGLLFLDGLRGLAAFYVMVGHARWLLWEGYGKDISNIPGVIPLRTRR